MIRRLRCVLGERAFSGGTRSTAADAAVCRGMADVLAALDNVIDDEAALAAIYAGIGSSMPGAAVTRPRAGRPAAFRGLLAPRRHVLRSAAGVAVALAAGAVALVAVELPGAGQGTVAGAVDTAYVVKRVDSALRVAGPGAIAQMIVT